MINVSLIVMFLQIANNVSTNEKEKINKYKDLCIDLLSLWRVHCEVIPLVMGWAA